MRIGLISGGIDSTLMALEESFRFDKLVYFNTNSGYNTEEINSLKSNGIDFEIIDVKFNVEPNHFSPLRNLLMISLVVNKYNATEVWLAGLKDDLCEDKNPEIFKEYSKVISKSLNRDVLIHSPYFGITKGELVMNNIHKSEAIKNTFSCYEPNHGKECGKCKACFRKWVALITNGIESDFDNIEEVKKYLKNLHLYNIKRRARMLIAINKKYGITAIDIDGVLCENKGDYANRKPLKENIEAINKINSLKVVYTARLSEDREVTEKWLNDNGLQYDALLLDKPSYNLFIDDLTISEPKK